MPPTAETTAPPTRKASLLGQLASCLKGGRQSRARHPCCSVHFQAEAPRTPWLPTAPPSAGEPVVVAAGSPAAAAASAPGAYGAPYDPSAHQSNGLSGGEIAGITVAALGGAIAVATGLAMFASYMRQRSQG